MNNLSSYCGLVDAKIRASDEDLPVSQTRKYADKYKNVVACYINVVDEYIFRLQSSISFYGV